MDAPKWMLTLAKKVAEAEGYREAYLPEIKVKNCRYKKLLEAKGYSHNSAGSFNRFYNIINISLGTHRRGQKHVLLHELTHWLMPPGEGHSPKFFEKAFDLYRRYGIPMTYAKKREFGYKKRAATRGYKQNLEKIKNS